MGAALRRETPVPVLQLLQAGIEPPEPVSGSESTDHHRGVFTLGQHFRRCRLRTGTARERPGRPPPPHAGAGDTSHPVEYTDLLAGEEAHRRRAVPGYWGPDPTGSEAPRLVLREGRRVRRRPGIGILRGRDPRLRHGPRADQCQVRYRDLVLRSL